MLNLNQLVAIVVGPRVPTALHRISRLVGFLVCGQITFRSFMLGLRPNAVTVSSKFGGMLGLDRALDRMMSHADSTDVHVVYLGRWFMSPWSLTWCRPIIGRDSDGNFHPGLECNDTSEQLTVQWLAPYVSFAEAWHVARHAHFHWRRKSQPFAAL